MKRTQEDWAIAQLREYGRVSRNEALQNFITRLGAITNTLNKEGWDIRGHFEKTANGKDYVYTLVDSPYRKVSYKVEGIEEPITRYETK